MRTRYRARSPVWAMRAARRDGTGSSGGVSVAWSIGGSTLTDGGQHGDRVSRRALLRGGAGGGGCRRPRRAVQGFVALANGAPRQTPSLRTLGDPRPARRQGPPVAAGGFQYRSFHDTEVTNVLNDGTVLPAATTAWGAFPGPNGNVVLVRNHEINNPGARSVTPPRRTTRWPRAAPRPPRDARRPGRQRHDQPQRHADELLWRCDAMGQLDHV